MIGKLKGVVDGVGAEEALLDVNGVGYVVLCGARTLSRLPAPGQPAALFIETQVREDFIRLYGFLSEAERAWFARLLAVQGVGAKVALAILDVLSPADLMAAAEREDKAAVARAKGVGPRVAQRVVAELKGKPAPQTRLGLGGAGADVRVAAGAGAGPGEAADGSDTEETAQALTVSDEAYRLREDAVSALANLGIPDADARAAVSAAQGADPDAGLDALVKTALKEIGR